MTFSGLKIYFDDDELALIATFVSSNPLSPEEVLAANDDANLFASSSSSDEWDAEDRSPYPTPKVAAYPLKAPIDTFNLEEASEDARLLFPKLYNNDHSGLQKVFGSKCPWPLNTCTPRVIVHPIVKSESCLGYRRKQ
jgi:hypothetical protein